MTFLKNSEIVYCKIYIYVSSVSDISIISDIYIIPVSIYYIWTYVPFSIKVFPSSVGEIICWPWYKHLIGLAEHKKEFYFVYDSVEKVVYHLRPNWCQQKKDGNHRE